jgi:sensor histidine kinase regulating citrate/malate metabolism
MNAKLSKFIETVRCIFDIIPDGVVIISPRGKILYANPPACRFYEKKMEDLVGRQAEEVNKPAWSEIIQIFEDGQPQIGSHNSLKGKLYTTSRLPLIFDGRIEAVVSFFQGLF